MVIAKDRRSVMFFVILTFVITYSLNIYMFLSGLMLKNYSLLQLQMLIPAICAVITIKLVSKERIKKFGIRLGRLKYYIWALMIPIFVNMTAFLLTYVLGLAVFDLSMPGLDLIISQMPFTMPREQFAVLVLAQGLILGPILGLPLALGEEFGWRAFLLSKLLTMGRGKAIILHGIIWGVWHIPAILMGLNYPGYPIIGSFFMVILMIIVGTFLGWIYFASRSVLVPSLAHGSLNQSTAVLNLFVVGLNPLTGGTTGVTGLLVWGIIALYLWRSERLNVIQKEDFE